MPSSARLDRTVHCSPNIYKTLSALPLSGGGVGGGGGGGIWSVLSQHQIVEREGGVGGGCDFSTSTPRLNTQLTEIISLHCI